jgi:hypothetical protein
LRAVNFVTNIYIHTGAGSDTVDLQGTLVTAGLLTIHTGADSDTVRTDNCSVRSCRLHTESGDDRVTLTGNLFDDLFADLGAGNDAIHSESTYRNRAIVRSGSGLDSTSGSNFFGSNNVIFEFTR